MGLPATPESSYKYLLCLCREASLSWERSGSQGPTPAVTSTGPTHGHRARDRLLHSRPISKEGFSSSAPQLSRQAPPQGPSSNPAHTEAGAAEPVRLVAGSPHTVLWLTAQGCLAATLPEGRCLPRANRAALLPPSSFPTLSHSPAPC